VVPDDHDRGDGSEWRVARSEQYEEVYWRKTHVGANGSSEQVTWTDPEGPNASSGHPLSTITELPGGGSGVGDDNDDDDNDNDIPLAERFDGEFPTPLFKNPGAGPNRFMVGLVSPRHLGRHIKLDGAHIEIRLASADHSADKPGAAERPWFHVEGAGDAQEWTGNDIRLYTFSIRQPLLDKQNIGLKLTPSTAYEVRAKFSYTLRTPGGRQSVTHTSDPALCTVRTGAAKPQLQHSHTAISDREQLKLEQVVWAKYGLYPWWPGRVGAVNGKMFDAKGQVCIVFFEEYQHSYIPLKKLHRFEEHIPGVTDGKVPKKHQKKRETAIQEAKHFLAQQQGLVVDMDGHRDNSVQRSPTREQQISIADPQAKAMGLSVEMAATRLHRRQCSSSYRGVSWHKQSSKWTASIMHEGCRQHLGRFTDEAEAARAFDARACQLLGVKAQLNFPRNSVAGTALQQSNAQAQAARSDLDNAQAVVSPPPIPSIQHTGIMEQEGADVDEGLKEQDAQDRQQEQQQQQQQQQEMAAVQNDDKVEDEHDGIEEEAGVQGSRKRRRVTSPWGISPDSNDLGSADCQQLSEPSSDLPTQRHLVDQAQRGDEEAEQSQLSPSAAMGAATGVATVVVAADRQQQQPPPLLQSQPQPQPQLQLQPQPPPKSDQVEYRKGQRVRVNQQAQRAVRGLEGVVLGTGSCSVKVQLKVRHSHAACCMHGCTSAAECMM
jgi:hypothetical protein